MGLRSLSRRAASLRRWLISRSVHKFRSRIGAVGALVVIVSGLAGSPVHAQPTLDHDIDLYWFTWNRTVYDDGDYDIAVGPRISTNPQENVSMMVCGELIAAFATFADMYINTDDGGIPRFAVTHVDGRTSSGAFTPRYIHEWLYEPSRFLSDLPPDLYPQGWGYKPEPMADCTVVPRDGALGRIGNPGVLENFKEIRGAVGIDWQTYTGGLNQAARQRIADNLLLGKPTLLIAQPFPDKIFTVYLVFGWDSRLNMYRVVRPTDRPRIATGAPPGTARSGSYIPCAHSTSNGFEVTPESQQCYQRWEQSITTVIDVTPVVRDGDWLLVGDDPSPLKFLSINPDGRRTGFDATTQRMLNDDPTANYSELGPWADPFLEIPPGLPAVQLSVREPVDGTYRFEAVGTANGRATYSFSTSHGGVDTVALAVSDTIATGEVRKYEMQYRRNGISTVTQVTRFTPQATSDGDAFAAEQRPAQFDGRRSFGVDGLIVSYLWDFGDGATDTGPQSSHTYATAGSYTTTLTVTDEFGVSATTTRRITIVPPQEIVLTRRVSVSTADVEANDASLSRPSLSGDGRFVAFSSYASNLVPNDTNQRPDVFVRDVQTNVTERVSVGPGGAEAVGGFGSFQPAISGDGRFVAFESDATNLVPGDTNCHRDVFVYDRQNATTERVSVSSSGAQTSLFGTGCGGGTSWSSDSPSINADGRFVAFLSSADNLVPNFRQGFPPKPAAYVRDRQTGTTELISAAAQDATISGNGRFVAFSSTGCGSGSYFGGIVVICLEDRSTGVIELISTSSAGDPPDASSSRPSISADGRFVAFQSSATNLVPNDTNHVDDVFVRDRLTGTTERISLSSTGEQMVFPFLCSEALALPPANLGNALTSFSPAITPDGRSVAFMAGGQCNSYRLQQVLLRDRTAGTTRLVSVNQSAVWGGAFCGSNFPPGDPGDIRAVAIAGSGRVAYAANCPNLVSNDTNQLSDVFVADFLSPKPIANPSGPYIGWAASGGIDAYVEVDASRSYDPNGVPIVAAKWDFGDGSSPVVTTTWATMRHTYAAPGNYVVTLVVNNGSVDSDPSTTAVDVLGPARPEGVDVLPRCGDPGIPVQISGIAAGINSQRAGGVNLAVATLSIPPVLVRDFDSTHALTVSSSDLAFSIPTTVPSGLAPGAYDVGIVGGASATFTTPCPASPHVPLANAGGPYDGAAGLPVSFDGSRSMEADGRAVTYFWNFGDGETGTGVKPQHSYARAGKYVASLVVDDGMFASNLTPGTHTYAKVSITDAPADAVPPTTIATVTQPPNAAGWNNSDVTVTLSSVDNTGGAGVKQITVGATGAQAMVSTTVAGASMSITIAGEGETTVTFFATDAAGNVEMAKSVTVRLDKTPPAIHAAQSPSANASGWNNTDVTVSFTCSDGGSGLAAGSPPLDAIVSTVGAGQSVTRTCVDVAGNSAAATLANINIDKTPPTITCAAAPAILWPPDHRLVGVATAVTVTDDVAGPAQFVLQSAASSEPHDGLGDGDTSTDIVGWTVGTPDVYGFLRAERAGGGTGRVYTLKYVAADKAGNTTSCTTNILVPHDHK